MFASLFMHYISAMVWKSVEYKKILSLSGVALMLTWNKHTTTRETLIVLALKFQILSLAIQQAKLNNKMGEKNMQAI